MSFTTVTYNVEEQMPSVRNCALGPELMEQAMGVRVCVSLCMCKKKDFCWTNKKKMHPNARAHTALFIENC